MSPVIPPTIYPFLKRSNYRDCFEVCFLVFGDILRKQIFEFQTILLKGIIGPCLRTRKFCSPYCHCFYLTYAKSVF